MDLVNRNVEQNTILDQVNQCVETGRNAVAAAKQRVWEHTEAGRERVGDIAQAGRERVGDLAQAGRERVGDIAQAGRERVGDIAQAGREHIDGAIHSAARVRAAADEYVESGRRVLHDARVSAKSTVEPLVDNARTLAESSTKRLGETRAALRTSFTNIVNIVRPPLSELSTSCTTALKKRDPYVLLAITAQLVAVVLLFLNALAAELCKVGRVNEVVVYVQNSALMNKAVAFIRWVDVPRTVQYAPFIGKPLVSAVTAFAEDVRTRMSPKTGKEKKKE